MLVKSSCRNFSVVILRESFFSMSLVWCQLGGNDLLKAKSVVKMSLNQERGVL